ncbi:MAG: T9SS type A sorting domain-containing protein [Bacteroidales bacterium]
MNHRIQIVGILAILCLSSHAQEYLSGLEYNAAILQLRRDAALNPSQKHFTTTGSIELPFLDDFSGSLYYPSPQLWQDSSAFVNLDFGVEAPSTGVATLDAIDKFGAIYPEALSSAFLADYLTSRPIRLDSMLNLNRPITRKDSVYLSFYYQPQGNGTAPAKNDSLILQFHSPTEMDTIDTLIYPVWRNVWYSTGMSLDTFRVKNNNKAFKQVLIPITDSALYYHNGFQFRFLNYASLANNILPSWQSNGDQWNIDYVFLNTGRSLKDTALNDVAFAGRAPSLLKNYEAMPYSQYRANYVNEMKQSLKMYIANQNNESSHISSYKYVVTKDFGTPVYTYNGGEFYILPFATDGYSDHPPYALPPVDWVYPIGDQQKVVFKTVHFLTTDPGLRLPSNDTLRYSQVFSNYYAYDDGTAEAGYGLTPAGSKLAYEFKLNHNDSLRGVHMYVNQSRTGGNLQYFTLTIWKDSYGKPGQIVFAKKSVKAYFTDSLNKYQTISLDTVLFIDEQHFPGRKFYIGWQQTTDDNLNIGFDKYNDASQHLWYNTYGTWTQSTFKGALMIRPIVGLANPVGISQPEDTRSSFEIYPNPASDKVNFSIPESCMTDEKNGYLRIIICDMAGITACNKPYSKQIDISSLSQGVYLVCLVNDHTHEQKFKKLLVTH